MAAKGRPAHVQLRLLQLLSTADEQLSGTAMADAIGGFAASSVYSALASMQADGLVKAQWDVSGSRPRRLYRITALGQRALADAERWSPALRPALGLSGA